MLNATSELAEMQRALAPFRDPCTRKAAMQLTNTLLPAILLWWLMLESLEVHYGLTLALAVPAAALRLRMFVLQHDCGHGSLFPSKRANELVGRLLSVSTLTPYTQWKLDHARHHAAFCNLDRRGVGDIGILTVAEYCRLPALKRLVYRVQRHPLSLFVLGGPVLFLLLHRLPSPRHSAVSVRSVLLTDLLLLVVVGIATQLVGLERLLLIELPVVVMASNFGIWLFFTGHTFERTYWDGKGKWRFQDAALGGCSYFALPGWLQRLLGHIGLHHIHHLSSAIPNYRLEACHRAFPQLAAASRVSVMDALANMRLSLWDEAARRAIPFSGLARVSSRDT